MVHPVYTYSGKGRTLQVYLDNESSYEKLAPIAEKVFKLHDRIKRTLPDIVKDDLGGRPGAMKEIGYSKGKMRWPLYYSPKQSGDFERVAYDIPAGFVYPILGAMRFLVEEDSNGKYRWKSDPLKLYDVELGKKLVELTLQASDELGRNPMAVGKSSRHWEGLYNYVAATLLTKVA